MEALLYEGGGHFHVAVLTELASSCTVIVCPYKQTEGNARATVCADDVLPGAPLAWSVSLTSKFTPTSISRDG